MSKIWSKIIGIIVVVIFFATFRSMILTDPTVSSVFKGLMSTLPFAEPFSEVVCNIMGYNNSQPLLSTGNFIEDIAKLMVMSCVQPALTAICSLIFLRIPSTVSGVDAMERHMGGIGYRVKEMLINVIVAPFSAVVSGWLIDWVINWSAAKFGTFGSFLAGLLSIILALGVSAIPMVIFGASVSVALLWRYTVTMIGGMLTVLITTLCSIGLYYALLNGIPAQIAGSIVSLLVGLILVDIVIQCFQRAIGAYSRR